MTFSFKHVGLLIGLISVIVSFTFFGRQQDLYDIFLTGGLLISLIFFLIIFFGKGTSKSKLIWTVIVVLFIVLQRLTEPILIDSSYRIYIRQNENILADINNILLHKTGDITILNDSITHKYDQLTTYESRELIKGQKKLGTYLISKSDKGIYYGLWGFLDVRLGIIFLTDNTKSENNYRHLTGNWFY